MRKSGGAIPRPPPPACSYTPIISPLCHLSRPLCAHAARSNRHASLPAEPTGLQSYSSKMMKSIWGEYNRYSVHNFKSSQSSGAQGAGGAAAGAAAAAARSPAGQGGGLFH